MPPKFTYRVRPIDIDGDNIPDGDLVEKVNAKGQVVSRKFVPKDKMEELAKTLPAPKTTRTPKQRVVYKDNNMEAQQQPVMVADQTSLGNHIKAGFGLGLGASAGQALFDGVASLF
jgi:hypothetical protein